jgi:hypothetical protein
MWRGFDENLEQGARCKSSITTYEIRACLRKILQRNFPQRRSSRSVRLILKTDKIEDIAKALTSSARTEWVSAHWKCRQLAIGPTP